MLISGEIKFTEGNPFLFCHTHQFMRAFSWCSLMCDVTDSHALYFIAPHVICTNSDCCSNCWKHPCFGLLKDCWVELCLSASSIVPPRYVYFHIHVLPCCITIIHFLGIVNHHQFKFDIVTLPHLIWKTACTCRLLYVVCHFT